MKFLITGGSGFVGQKFSRALLEKYGSPDNDFIFIARQRGLDFLKDFKNAKIKVVTGDVSNYDSIQEAFRGVDYVFHLAAKVDYGDFDTNAYYRINVEGTKNIFELSLKNKAKKVIYLSTAAIFHPTYENYAHEETEINEQQHLTHYSKSKYLAYKYVHEYQARGLNIITILPASVFDYGAPLFEPFILMGLKYRIAILPALRGRMSLVALDDLVNYILLGLEPAVNNKVIIASDIDWSLERIVREMEKIYRKKIYLIKLPNLILKYYFFIVSVIFRLFHRRVFLNYELFKFIDANFLVKSIKQDEIGGYKFKNFEEEFNTVIKKYIKQLTK